MVFEIRIIINRDVGVSLRIEKLGGNIVSLFQISLAIRRRVVRSRKTCFELGGIWPVVVPRGRPASTGREVIVSREPEETDEIMSTSKSLAIRIFTLR